MQINFTNDENNLNPEFTSNSKNFNPQFTSDGVLTITTGSNQQTVPIQFNADPVLDLDFGSVVVVDRQGEYRSVYYGSTQYWNDKTSLIAERGCIYIYSDWLRQDDGKVIPGFKVGDGTTLLSDLLFTDELWLSHIYNDVRHITQEERDRWNNKVSVKYNPDMEQLKFEI